MKRGVIVLFLIVMVAVALPFIYPVHAAVIPNATVEAIDDCWVDSVDAGANHNDGGLRRWTVILGVLQENDTSFMRFDMNFLPQGFTLLDVDLFTYMNQKRDEAEDQTSLWGYNDDSWNEATLTHITANWSASQGPLVTKWTTGENAGEWTTWGSATLLNYFNERLALANRNVTLFIAGRSDFTCGATYNSSEASGGCPYLTYVGGHFTIDNRDVLEPDGSGWLFCTEKYYDFHAVMSSVNDTIEVAWQDAYSNTMTVYYDIQKNMWGCSDEYLVLGRVVASYNATANTIDVVWPVMLKDTVFDTMDVDFSIRGNDTNADSTGWFTARQDYAHIYNLGGYGTLQTSGSAGRITKGDIFELYAQNNSWAQANMTFHKLQHFHTYFHIWVADQRSWDDWETDNITIEMGMDYNINNTWLQGWNVYLEQYEGWLNSQKMRLRWTVKWFYQGNEIWTSTINSFPLINKSTDSGVPAATTFIADLWFNKVNASSTIGGRVTAEQFAMIDNSEPWLRWATGSSWGADVGNVTQAMFFETLLDANDDLVSSMAVDMMRVWVRLSQGANDHDVRVELRDYDLFDVLIAPNEMEGVNTPIFIATKTPDMPQGGFLNSLWGALQGAFNWVAEGLSGMWWGLIDWLSPIFEAAFDLLVGLWGIIVEALDDLCLAIFGVDNMFSNLTDSIVTTVTQLALSLAYLGTTLTNAFTMATQLFSSIATFFSGIMGWWVWLATTITQPLIDTMAYVAEWWTGTGIFGDSIPGETLTTYSVLIGLVALFARCAEQASLEPLMTVIEWSATVIMFLYNIFHSFISGTIQILHFIRQAIPKILGTG